MASAQDVCLDGVIEGAVNFRDLGGLPAGDAYVRPGLVYRSAMTHRITERGVRTLVEELGVRTVIDLRAAREREEDGLLALDGFDVQHHHVPMADTVNAPAEVQRARYEQMRNGVFDWPASYQRMTRNFASGFREFFALLARPAALPAVFHCTAGRDRTGVAAALLLRSLGVSDETIAEDYARTGVYLRPHVRHFIRVGARMQISDEQMMRVLDTRAEAMHTFLAGIDREHGSVEGYLDSIGVSEQEVDTLRGLLLAE